MKKITIITFPEYEGLVLDSLGAAGVTQLKEVTGPDYEDYRKEAKGPDYKGLYSEIDPGYKELQRLISFKVMHKTPSLDVLRDYAREPEKKTKEAIQQLDRVLAQLRSVKEAQENETTRIAAEADEGIQRAGTEYREKKRKLIEEHASRAMKIEIIRKLGSDDVSKSLGYGIITTDYMRRLEQHLQAYTDVKVRGEQVSPGESLVVVTGPEDARKWVSNLFLVFEITDLSVVFGQDAKIVLDPAKRLSAYEKSVKELDGWVRQIQGAGQTFEEKLAALDADGLNTINKLEGEKAERLKTSAEQWKTRYSKAEEEIKEKEAETLGQVAFCHTLLALASDSRAPVMRTKVYSIMQGWIPSYSMTEFNAAIADVEKAVGEQVIVEVENVGKEEKGVPTPPPIMKPGILQGTWKLTTLRGWPSFFEINPAYISLFIFSLQFGFMFGDIGQGAVFLILGLVLANKFKRGMMSKLGSLFIPMGISAMIFGFLYGSFFLTEIAQRPAWLPVANEGAGEAGLKLYTAILPNPATDTIPMMYIIVNLAVVEIMFGLLLSAINQIKKGNPIGVVGEHGLGMALAVLAVYEAVTPQFTPKADLSLTLQLMGAGLACSFIEPIIHGLASHHFSPMEAVSEGIGGLLMTFVEGLGNMFSFLRVAAFAVAHASLAIAAVALGLTLGAVTGLIVMNVVAMTFELISSSVQSMRLLYYEFMGKFFNGEGTQFRPFRLGANGRLRNQSS